MIPAVQNPTNTRTRQGRVPWVRHMRLLLNTAAEHFATDPVVFALQVSRRLPAAVTQQIAQPLSRCAPWAPAIGALGLHMSGADNSLDDIFDKAVSTNTDSQATASHGTRLSRLWVAWQRRRQLHINRRLAEVAVAVDALDHAFRLTADLPVGFRAAAGTRARRDWSLGQVTSAVENLQRAWLTNTATSGEKRQLLRLADERAQFYGADLALYKKLGSELAVMASTYRPRPRTVVHVLTNSVPYTSSGYALRSHSLLRSQAEQGWTVHAMTRPGYPVHLGKLAAPPTEIIDGVTYHRITPGRLPLTALGRLELFAEELLLRCLITRPTVLHTTTHFVNAMVVREVATILGIPWVYEVRGQLADTWASRRPPASTASERYRRFTEREAQAVLDADSTTALGSTIARHIQHITEGRLTADNIPLAPNSVGVMYEQDPEAVSEVRAALRVDQFGLDPEGFLIGTVTSVVDYEGLDDLIRAMVSLPQQISAVIVGEGAAKPGLQELSRSLGLVDRVVFVGRVNQAQAHAWQRALDVFVVPRRDRAVTRAVAPLKVVEASASQIPVVASDLPAIAETVQDGVTGLLVPPENPNALAHAIRTLWADFDLRHRLGQAGRQAMMKHRTWSSVAGTTLSRYQQMTEARQSTVSRTTGSRRTA